MGSCGTSLQSHRQQAREAAVPAPEVVTGGGGKLTVDLSRGSGGQAAGT